ncbi:cgi-41 methyltransferase [Holotrichia oblita]|uniref:Cgi-41 methyltransferase n=1 Tax=Holotrichia oblita TaxID=644536 RepID=A0ACB9SVX4_HOLOL|nr:cgi-41 methyltransferase [Holotrichia oblita]
MENLMGILKQYSPIINAHMVDYFTKDSYENCVPSEIKNEIDKIGYDNAVDYILNKEFNEDMRNLNNFIETVTKYTLRNRIDVCLNVDQLKRNFVELGCKNVSGLHLNVFMKPKKSHEVEILSEIAASLKTIGNISHLVDIGDGKGYLSSLLSLHYKIPVLGIDAAAINTIGAIKRVEKLGKYWHGIVGTNKSVLSKSETKYENAYNLLYKQITQYITEETDLKELVQNIFVEQISYIGIVGLHTCGNLAPASLKIYASNDDVKILCNVSCCYHLLSEKSLDTDCETNIGFPMSQFLLEKQFYLGRNARMLSAHSTDRIFDKKELPNRNIFYRAVFEVFLSQYFPNLNTKEVGRFRGSNIEFKVYARKALKRLNIDDSEFSDEDLNKCYTSLINKEKQLYTFTLLRCLLAPLIESLILLDRLIYLYENGFGNSYLVQLFDPVVSPRCYGIISYKE